MHHIHLSIHQFMDFCFLLLAIMNNDAVSIHAVIITSLLCICVHNDDAVIITSLLCICVHICFHLSWLYIHVWICCNVWICYILYNFMFNSLRNCQVVFQWSGMILHKPPAMQEHFHSSTSCQYLFSEFLIMAILVGLKGYIILMLICNSLMTN